VSVVEDMSNIELQGWFDYFKRRPPGWQEDQRAAMLMNAWGAKKKPEELFPTLKQMKAEEKRSSKYKSVAQQFMARFGDRFPELKLVEGES
jgi:hypothetical protein